MNLLKCNRKYSQGIALVFLFMANACFSYSNNSTLPINDSLTLSNLNKFIGKKTEKLFAKLREENVDRYYIEEPPAQLVGVELEMKENSTILKVYFKRLKYVEKENWNRDWDWKMLSREKIARIDVYRDGDLIHEYGRD